MVLSLVPGMLIHYQHFQCVHFPMAAESEYIKYKKYIYIYILYKYIMVHWDVPSFAQKGGGRCSGRADLRGCGSAREQRCCRSYRTAVPACYIAPGSPPPCPPSWAAGCGFPPPAPVFESPPAASHPPEGIVGDADVLELPVRLESGHEDVSALCNVEGWQCEVQGKGKGKEGSDMAWECGDGVESSLGD